MAVNKSALDALNSLATGGSQGLDAYKQAQQNEANSRTQALQGALGGNEVYDAAMKSQGQYSPKVGGTGFENAGSLLPAANQYLSEAANRIASENYVSHLKDTAANRDKQLLGASEVMANQQRDALGGKLDAQYGSQGVTDLVAKRAELEQRRQALGLTEPGSQNQLAMAAAMGGNNPEIQQRLADVNALSAEMQANENALRQAYGGYAQAAGTDTKGFDAALAAGNITGGAGSGSVADLVGFLHNDVQANREAAQGQEERAIQMGGQARLRELAPLFGYDPLEAEGMFSAGTGNDLARANKVGGEADYVAGTLSPADRRAQDNEHAANLGFATGNAYSRAKNVSGMGDAEIADLMQSPDWQEVDSLASAFQQGDKSVTGDASGLNGFKERIQNFVKDGYDEGANGERIPWDDSKKKKFSNLATEYYNSRVGKSAGAGETAG